MKYKITIEEVDTDNKIDIDCEDFIVSTINKRKEGVLFSQHNISGMAYTDITRLHLAGGVQIYNGFQEQNKEQIEKLREEKNND